jgi:hypothetical protein
MTKIKLNKYQTFYGDENFQIMFIEHKLILINKKQVFDLVLFNTLPYWKQVLSFHLEVAA